MYLLNKPFLLSPLTNKAINKNHRIAHHHEFTLPLSKCYAKPTLIFEFIIMSYAEKIERQRHYFNQNITKDMTWRIEQLTQLKKLITDNEQVLCDALAKDLSKPYQEAWLTEVSYITTDINHTLKHLKSWCKTKRVSTPIIAMPSSSYIQPEPLGTILIIGAWNYPLQLILAPLIAVIAAGNCAVLKPSELASATADLLEALLPKYLDQQAICLFQGGVEETSELLACRFDHIMYTGNSQVAKIVMTAAAKYLTPVTLELGGKSPVYIDKSANITIAAQRIAWGKWMNCGQTCIAPDYLLIHQDIQTEFIAELQKQIQLMFTNSPQSSDSYGRIINTKHTERLANYLTDTNLDVSYGGETDISERYMSPTIVINPPSDSALMQEEIFGPILPVITVTAIEDAIQHITANEKPLAAYLFSKNQEDEQTWLQNISAGSVAINDVMMFTAVADLPFGGVGNSGMGQYCGKVGFDNFSHLKSIIKRHFIKDLPLRFAPYSTIKLTILKWLR